jgi:hypothetical protein
MTCVISGKIEIRAKDSKLAGLTVCILRSEAREDKVSIFVILSIDPTTNGPLRHERVASSSSTSVTHRVISLVLSFSELALSAR